MSLRDLLDDPSCREKTARLVELLGPGNEGLIRYICDPLMSVDLTDQNWAERFDAEHPVRKPR